MATKSDMRGGRGGRRISATEASRSFSRILDSIESGGRVLVRRRGRDVCVMAPPTGEGRKASECLVLLRGRAPVRLDARFGRDLARILAAEGIEKRPKWDS